MPVYAYECEKCGPFHQLRELSEPPLTECPSCLSPCEKRMHGSVQIVTRNGFEKQTDKCRDQEKLHQMRLHNKRCIERDWDKKVENGSWEYVRGDAPDAYVPEQAKTKKIH